MLGSSATDVSSGSAACGGTTGTPRTCTIPIPAPPASDSFVFTSYDAPPSGGSFAAAKALGAGLVAQTVAQGQSNVVNVTLGGIVSAVPLSLPTPLIRGTVASQQQPTVAALDADGNIIVTDGYVDANGNPVTLFIGAAPNPSSEIILSGTALTAPAPAGVIVTYNGTATAAYASTITATASSGPTATTALTLIGPKETVFPTTTANSFPFAITNGPDGNLWIADANNGLLPLTPAGSFPGPAFGPAAPELVAAGPDGNLWATEEGGSAIGRWDDGRSAYELPHAAERQRSARDRRRTRRQPLGHGELREPDRARHDERRIDRVHAPAAEQRTRVHHRRSGRQPLVHGVLRVRRNQHRAPLRLVSALFSR